MRLLLFYSLVIGVLSEVPTIKSPSGSISGKRINVLGKLIDEYLGIPFAKSPVGDLRFKKPEAIEKYDEPIVANKMPLSCPQVIRDVNRKAFSEDCLFLNVWNPNTDFDDEKTPLKPVMVWIYGGGFEAGSIDFPLYHGAILSAYGDVIVVTANYRVGLAGFFSSGGEDEPGNLGLHDQVLALHWVQDNIQYFGGDPSKVTIFGESAGSMSVAFHILSPLSEGLFSRAILESGAHLTPNVEGKKENIVMQGNQLALELGCATESENLFSSRDEVMNCLRKKDIAELIKFEANIQRRQFKPIYGDAFLPFDSFQKFNTGKGKKVDIIIGVNKDEGNFMLPYFFSNINFNDPEKMMTKSQALTFINTFLGYTTKNPERLSEPYFKDVEEEDVVGSRTALSEIISDCFFICPSLMFADYQVQNAENVYFYYFTHLSQRPSHLPQWMGVTHFVEIPFVFGIPTNPTLKYPSEDVEISKDMMEMWTNFAKGSSPNEDWLRYKPKSSLAYELKPQPRSVTKVLRAQLCYDLWIPEIEKYQKEEYVKRMNASKEEL